MRSVRLLMKAIEEHKILCQINKQKLNDFELRCNSLSSTFAHYITDNNTNLQNINTRFDKVKNSISSSEESHQIAKLNYNNDNFDNDNNDADNDNDNDNDEENNDNCMMTTMMMTMTITMMMTMTTMLTMMTMTITMTITMMMTIMTNLTMMTNNCLKFHSYF